jgi:hypothetical protein
MSLSLPPSWNQPILVAASGVVAAALLPAWERQQQMGDSSSALSLSSLRLLQVAAYALNVLATAQPGRLDGQEQQEASLLVSKKKTTDADDATKTKTKNEDADMDPTVASISTGRRGRTLLIPKGWAFAIWAPIFMGELIHVGASCLSPSFASTTTLLHRTAPGFVMAQIFQTLWAASFRPKYKGLASFISFAMLSGIALSLNGPHAAIAAERDNNLSLLTYLLHGLPITLHFGWTTAASLVNLNGCLAMMDDSSDTLLTAAGHASVVVATVLGVAVTVSRRAPVYGGVICWALLACADGMVDRLRSLKQQSQPNDQSRVTAARVQKWLCRIGAGLVAAATVVVTFVSR